jgi:hypothetical protein
MANIFSSLERFKQVSFLVQKDLKTRRELLPDIHGIHGLMEQSVKTIVLVAAHMLPVSSFGVLPIGIAVFVCMFPPLRLGGTFVEARAETTDGALFTRKKAGTFLLAAKLIMAIATILRCTWTVWVKLECISKVCNVVYPICSLFTSLIIGLDTRRAPAGCSVTGTLMPFLCGLLVYSLLFEKR